MAEKKNFTYYFDKIAWGCITAIAVYASTQLKEMSQSIGELNKNVAVTLSRMQGYDEQAQEMKSDITRIEIRLNEIEKK